MKRNRKRKIVVMGIGKGYWKWLRRALLVSFFIGIGIGVYFKADVDIDEEKEVYYEVQVKDSINKIARKFKILPWQLRFANGMEAEDELIKPGQILIIPRPKWKSYHGKASWYGKAFHGKPTASGEIYDQNKISIAHRTLPLWIDVRITNIQNGRSIVAPVIDRGPYTVDKNGRYKREIDLSFAAAEALGAVEKGEISVLIEPQIEQVEQG